LKDENELIPNNFLHLYPSLNFEDISKIYSNSTLSLNVIELRNTGFLNNPTLKLHLRTFEIPMSGGLMFIRRSDELQKYFTEDKEVICFNSNDEMVSKADYYLNRASNKEILNLKLAARRRSLSEHTWQNRFNSIFKNIN
jgi:spore maturation protein CgeB